MSKQIVAMQETAKSNTPSQESLLADAATSGQSRPTTTNAATPPIPPRRPVLSGFASSYKDTLRNTMAAAKQDHWKISVVKATTTDRLAPKGKHVRCIMEGLRFGGDLSNRESPAGGVLYHLQKRMQSSHGVVVVKALTVFHHILRDGRENYVEQYAELKRNQFDPNCSFTTEGQEAYSFFVAPYADYLRQWLEMKAAIKFPLGTSKEDDVQLLQHFHNCTRDKFVADIPVLMDTISENLECPRTDQRGWLKVLTPMFTMLDSDLKSFLPVLQNGLLKYIDMFLSLERADAQRIYSIYKRYVQLITQASELLESPSSFRSIETVPELRLDAIPLDLEASMIKYIKSDSIVTEKKDELQF